MGSMGPLYSFSMLYFLHSGYSVYGSLYVTVRAGLSLTVNHTYARQVLLGWCSLPKLRFNNGIPTRTPFSGHFST